MMSLLLVLFALCTATSQTRPPVAGGRPNFPGGRRPDSPGDMGGRPGRPGRPPPRGRRPREGDRRRGRKPPDFSREFPAPEPDLYGKIELSQHLMGPGYAWQRRPFSEQIVDIPASVTEIEAFIDSLPEWQTQISTHDILFTNAPVQERPIFDFIHVPKTAGQSFSQALQKAFIPPTGDSPDTRNPNAQALFAGRNSKNRFAPRLDYSFAASGLVNVLKGRPEAVAPTLDGWDFFLGHHDISFPWAHERINPMLVTFVREPVARFYSYYDFLRQGSDTIRFCLESLDVPRGMPPMLRGREARQGRRKDRNLLAATEQYEYEYDTPTNMTGGSQRKMLALENIKGQVSQFANRMGLGRMMGGNQGICPPPLHGKLQREGVSDDNLESWWQEELTKCMDQKMFHVESLPPNTTPEELAELLPGMGLDNYMTKAFSGTSTFSYFGTSDHIPDDERIRLAKKALDKFAFVGLTEKYAQHLEMFAHTFGLSMTPENRVRNKSRNKAERDPELVERIKQMDFMDEQVYFHAAYLAHNRYLEFKGRTPNW